jgi:hypothetical protein
MLTHLPLNLVSSAMQEFPKPTCNNCQEYVRTTMIRCNEQFKELKVTTLVKYRTLKKYFLVLYHDYKMLSNFTIIVRFINENLKKNNTK